MLVIRSEESFYAASFPKALKPQYRFTQINDFLMKAIVLFSWGNVFIYTERETDFGYPIKFS